MFKSVGVVGCGLIGGSLALTIKKSYPNTAIFGINRRLDDIKADPRSACFTSLGTTVENLPKDVDVVFICVPIAQTVPLIKEISTHVQKTTLLTDIASVKEKIYTEVQALDLPQPYIAGHPMAGKETTRFAAATDTLFSESPYVLIPENNQEMYASFKAWLGPLVGHIVELDTQQHDDYVARVSHLPYISASMLMKTASMLIEPDMLKQIYGPGFRDSTRVAASDPEWGVAICKDNKQAISKALALFIEQCNDLKQEIDQGNGSALRERFTKSQSDRQAIQ